MAGTPQNSTAFQSSEHSIPLGMLLIPEAMGLPRQVDLELAVQAMIGSFPFLSFQMSRFR
ncbi:MAG: hypothetical protein ACOX2E_06635 [Syntrophaceticus sp.]